MEKKCVQPITNPWLRWIVLLLGFLAVLLGVIGLFLPIVPTTPFLLLAAVCFARASERCHSWLLSSPFFGKAIKDWNEERALPLKTKIYAITLIAITMSVSIVFFVPFLWAKIVMALIAVGVSLFLVRIPTKKPSSHKEG